MAVLRHVLLLQRSVPASAKFYADGLGLSVNVCTERWAELQSGPTRLGLKAVDGCVQRLARLGPALAPRVSSAALTVALPCACVRSEAAATTGYSPILSFAVADVSATVARCLALGAVLDGAIKYPPGGPKVAALRAPDGHMIGLVEDQ
jgi:catechol 2,3-dioxygenase-like lactoylglutathione lyase family enzyme